MILQPMAEIHCGLQGIHPAGLGIHSERMWPKVIAQLFELLPHVSRVLPLADRYFSTRSSADTAIASLGETVRSDLGRVANAHTALAGRLDDFAAHVSEAAADARKARLATESIEARLTRIEQAAATRRTLLLVVCVLLVAALGLLLVLLLRNR